MDNPIKPEFKVHRDERFRAPSPLETALNLWIDRIGAAAARFENRPRKLRILGLHASVYVESGDGVFLTRTLGEKRVGAGDTMLLFPEEPSLYYPDASWRTRWVVWNGSEADQLVQAGYFSPLQPIVRGSAGCVSIAHSRLMELMDHDDRGAILERKKILLDMLLGLHKCQHADRNLTPSQLAVKGAVDHLTNRLDEPVFVPDLAARFNLSETHFRRLFKERTGRGPVEFVAALRVAKAKELLAAGKSIKETAAQVGYDDVFYFMRVFKKRAGISPGRFGRQ